MMGELTRFKKEGDEYMVDENHEGSGGVRRSAGSFHVEALQMFLEGCALQKFNNACHCVLTHIH